MLAEKFENIKKFTKYNNVKEHILSVIELKEKLEQA